MSFPIGWSWTKTHFEDVTGNPDGSITKNVRVQGGPFYYNPDMWGWLLNRYGYRLECYAGMRDGAPWNFGFGNEGIFPIFKKLMLKIGCSNIGFAFRFKKITDF